MGQKDISQKILEDYNDVFSDIVNVLVFQGRQIVKPEDLMDTKLRSHYKADDTQLHEQARDVAKFWTAGGIIFAVCGLENQTTIDYDMPLRVIGYDGAAYREQLLNKENNQRYPVMTLILYYGKRHWKTPRTIKERVKVPNGLKDYISDYRINIFEISYLKEEQVKMFQSDFQIVADYFVQTRKGKKYQRNTKTMRHVDAMLNFLSIFAEDRDYLNVDLSKYEGGINMCVVLQEAKMFGIREGIERGRQEGIERGRQEGIERGRREGIERGRQEGENQLAELISQLISLEKFDDIKRVTEDKEYRKELYRQFRIAR